MYFLRENIQYWQHQDCFDKEKMEGLTFSILVALDGCSGSFNGCIEDLVRDDLMLHDQFYEK